MTDYCDLEQFYTENSFYSTAIAESLGQTLAEFHRLTLDNLDYKSFLKLEADIDEIPDFGKDLNAIYPEIFGRVSSDGIKFYQLYQRDPSLAEAIAKLNDLYEPCCLIHDDLKFNNILLNLNWQDFGQDLKSPIRLIDWEKWSWGDPGLDLGSIIASYLKLWLNSVTVNSYISIEQALSLAATPLEVIQPSLISVFQSYCRHFPEILAEFPDFLVRVMQYAGLNLIESILAKLDYYEPFDNISICLLQVAKSLLCTPEKAIPTVFGLTTEQLLKLDKQLLSDTSLAGEKESKGAKIRDKTVKNNPITLPSHIFGDNYDLAIQDIAEKIQIQTDYSLVYGDRNLTLPEKLQNYFVQLSPTQQETYLKYQLRDFLHEIYFSNEQTNEEDSTTELKNNLHHGINIDFYQQLSDRNCGKGYFDFDWKITAKQNKKLLLAEKDGLTLHLNPKRHLSPDLKNPQPGDIIAIRLPHNRIESEFYVAVGDAGLINDTAATISVYFNIDPQGAIALMEKLTEYLNKQIIPFEFSVLINPEDYQRYDAAILRLEHQDYKKIESSLKEIVAATRLSHFQPQTPLFTKPIAPGVSFAEEPLTEPYDFGLNRCQIIAEALITAWTQKQRSPKAKINLIQQYFTQQGVDLKRPYLNSLAKDIY